MSNKINKQLKKGSPLFDLGQGIASLLDFEAIGRASNPNRDTGSDLFGRSLIHLGAIMSQLDEDEKPEIEDKPDNGFDKFLNTEKPTIEFERPDLSLGVITGDPKQDPPKTVAETVSTTPESKPDLTTGGGGNTVIQAPPEVVRDTTGSGTSSTQQMIRTDIANNPEKLRNGFPTIPQKENKGPGNIQLLSSGTYLGNQKHTEGSKEAERLSGSKEKSFLQSSIESLFGDDVFKGGVNWFGEDDVLERKKDDNPIKRLALEQPETFEKFKGLMYKRRHAGESPLRKIAHIYNSPFTRTDQTPDMEGVDYRYMQRATMPEYAKQGFGSAAAEGFNLAIDRQNYKRAAQESYDRELEDEMGELVIDYDPSAGENFNKDRLEALSGWKSEYSNMKAQYARGEISNAELKAGLQNFKDQAAQFKAAQDTLGQLRQQFMESKGTHDIEASKPQMVDFYNTLEHNPDSFTVKNIDGVQHLVGTTEQGKEVKVPVSKVANGQAGFKLVQKVNPLTYVDAGNKVASTYIEEYATKYGIGKGNVSAEQIRPRMEQYFYTVIGDDVNKLRSLAAAQGLDYDGFEQLINATGDAKKENMQLIKNDIVQDLMQDFEATYFPKSVTTKYDPNKTGITPASATKEGAVDQRTRTNTEQILSAYNNLGEITTESVSGLAGLGKIDDAQIDKNGNLRVMVNKQVIKLSNNPEVRQRQIVTLAGGNPKYIK